MRETVPIKESMLYEKLPGNRVRCNVCEWRCIIGSGHYGVCRTRRNDGGTLTLLNYGLVSSAHVDPIEKKPLSHFYPGTLVFSLGSLGCNFHCKHCQNWEIAFTAPEEGASQAAYLSPEQAIELAVRHGCSGIAWTYNEPSIWLEYTLDSAKLAKERGLYTVYVTNGFMTPEALDAMGPYLDAFRVDIKGFTDGFYRDLARISSRWRQILEVTKRARFRWDMHVEVVNNVIPTMNDDDAQFEGLACWIRDNLGELTPLHLTAFHPSYKLRHLPATPVGTLERGYQIAKRVGLRFVYIGNVPGHRYENTLCYSCGQLVVSRMGYSARVVGLEGSQCRYCGTELNFKTAAWRRQPTRA